ncbi:MAG TPA: zinc ribbon domain-containing protein [Steroidobacteraceae bacterium]|nr:zinc ribbon domain-containing protein [Steroidobacteraceae bacterium]
MPIYEYRCAACSTTFTHFSRRIEVGSHLACERCGADAERLISSFALHRSLQTQIDQLDPRFEKQLDAVDNAKRPRLSGDSLRLPPSGAPD